MANIRVTIESIDVHNNGDRKGKGEIYWKMTANDRASVERNRNNILKVRDGESITIGDDMTVESLNHHDSLTIRGSVSERDGVFSGDDESASFRHVYHARDNWGVGSYDVSLRDGPLDLTLHYKIESY